MPITSQNVKLYKSAVMTDAPEGGGRMSGNEVIDGELNNVFTDTSRDDRVNGRVSLRKVYGAVSIATDEPFLGAHAIVTDPPEDGRVVVTMMTLNSHTDRRDAAQGLIENYLVPGASTVLTLYDSQPQSARTVTAYQNVDDPMPEVSEVLCLSIERVSDANYGHQQFVRITEIEHQTVTITTGSITYTKRLITFTVSEPLEVTYPGADIKQDPQLSDRPTRVRKADLNAAAQFYGVAPVTEPIDAGDTLLHVDSILQSIAPASYSETPLLDQQIGSDGPVRIPAGPEFAWTGTVVIASTGATLRLLRPSLPGSLDITIGTGVDEAIFEDAGGGVLSRIGGGTGTATAAGTINYLTGDLAFTGLTDGTRAFSAAFVPAAIVRDVQHTKGTEITLANRGFNYAFVLIPKPAAGSTVVTFRALGRWYTLTDNGAGQLIGAPGVGAGTVNYLTGTVNATLGYQPDVGSYVLCGYLSAVHYVSQAAATDIDLGAIEISTTQVPRPGTVELEWTVGATTYTVTDDGIGNLTGAGTGRVEYWAKRIVLKPTLLPAKGTVISIGYDDAAEEIYNSTPTPAGGSVTITLPETPVEPGSVYLFAVYELGLSQAASDLRDNGAGVLYRGESAFGTINYATGVAVFPDTVEGTTYVWNPVTGVWDVDAAAEFSFGGSVHARYQTNAAGSAQSDSYTLNQLSIDVASTAIDRLIPGSLLFTLNGRHYYDNAAALQYRNSTTDVTVGTFDAVTGLGTITDWVAGAFSATLRALLTRYGRWTTASIIWRTPGSPLRASSFQVTDGSQVAIANGAGALTGAANISGSIDVETGVYQVAFTAPIDPDLARYNAVVLTYLPSDPVLLGLNAVRLPLDGRVPVFAAGRMLVIHNTQTEALPNPVVAGTTYALSRGALAYAIAYDAAGEKIPSDRYTADLDVGEVTFANPLDLSDYTQPLEIEHRIEDTVQCVDAQLSGDVQVFGEITHDFPEAGTHISSALRFGVLQASTTVPFDQSAWTGEWSDSQIGGEAPGEYNFSAYPIEVNDAGAITERWRVEFTSATAFRLYGEDVGLIANGETGTDFAPVNPATGQPYMRIRALGWGGGFGPGNQLRFNTRASAAPIWLIRCTLQGPVTEPNDSVRIQFRGDAQ